MNKKADERVQRLFVGVESSLNRTDPEFVEIISNFSQDETAGVSKLTEKEQMLCILSALLGCQGMGEFRNMLHAALNMGIEPVAVKEVIYQAAAYLGIGRIYDFLVAANQIMEQHGVELPLTGQVTTDEKTRFQEGLAKQVSLFGPGMAKRQTESPALRRNINRWLADNCFGDYYTQVLSGAFDTLSHAMETYLGASDKDNVSDDVALAIMRNTVVNMRRLLTDMDDMEARSNLMWDSAMAENGILKCGRLTDFQAHQIEHQLGAYTDCNHGQGLAVIHPAYYRNIVKDAPEKFARFAKAVFDADTAEGGVDALENFIKECGLPAKMNQLRSAVEITPEVLRQVADTCNIIKSNPRELGRDEIYEILLECL